MEQRKVDITQEQMKQAATAGVQLLNTPGAVNVPSPMAISGVMGVLNSMLTAIANGEVILMNVAPMKVPEGGGKTPPDGNGEKKPDLKKPVETGKQAEK
jgi:hypothetical protein